MWSDNISRPTHERVTSVGGKNHSRCHGGLQEGVKVRETFDVQHVNLMDWMSIESHFHWYLAHLINKDDTGNNLSNTLVNVALDDLVDLSSQFFCHFRPATFH